MPMDNTGIAYMGYESPNYKEMMDYGPQVFGFGLNESFDDDAVYLTMDDRAFRIAVHPGETNRLAYIGLEMKDRWAWEAGVEQLRRGGIEVTIGDAELEERRGVLGVAQFKDPSGWPHELIYGHRYLTDSFASGRPHQGFQSSKYGVGHTVLTSHDLAATEAYARDIMEYKWFLAGLRKGGASFWRCKLNNLSHNVAYGYNPNHVIGDTATSIPHMGLYCKTLDDVGIAWDLVQDRNPESIQMTLGRHMQDPVISFYSVTPTGFVIEYIWGEDLEIPEGTYIEGMADELSVWGHRRPDGSQMLPPRAVRNAKK
jgi:2,3-dihydroxybiphenyl 1,2-dioxygenase